jgi:hypothetical protein
MEYTFPVQKASFRGIYEMVNGIFTPKSLDWFVLTDEDLENSVNFYFENKRGLTFMIIKHTCIDSWTLQIPSTKKIVDNPFDLGLVGVSLYIPHVGLNNQNIIGPFSGSFDIDGIISGILTYPGTMAPGESLSVAVVSLPQGSM